MADAKTNGHEIPENEKKQEEADLAAEFAALGKKFAEALGTAWNSEERMKLQEDLQDGLNRFTSEVDEALTKVRESDGAKKVQAGVQRAAEDVKSGKAAHEVRRGLVTALRSVSEALDRMAGSFTPASKEETPRE